MNVSNMDWREGLVPRLTFTADGHNSNLVRGQDSLTHAAMKNNDNDYDHEDKVWYPDSCSQQKTTTPSWPELKP